MNKPEVNEAELKIFHVAAECYVAPHTRYTSSFSLRALSFDHAVTLVNAALNGLNLQSFNIKKVETNG